MIKWKIQIHFIFMLLNFNAGKRTTQVLEINKYLFFNTINEAFLKTLFDRLKNKVKP